MATKQVNAVSLTIRIEVPIVYPLSVAAAIEWEASGLSEMGGRHASLSGSIPSGSVTIAQIISALKAQQQAQLENEGSGNHTVVDRA